MKDEVITDLVAAAKLAKQCIGDAMTRRQLDVVEDIHVLDALTIALHKWAALEITDDTKG